MQLDGCCAGCISLTAAVVSLTVSTHVMGTPEGRCGNLMCSRLFHQKPTSALRLVKQLVLCTVHQEGILVTPCCHEPCTTASAMHRSICHAPQHVPPADCDEQTATMPACFQGQLREQTWNRKGVWGTTPTAVRKVCRGTERHSLPSSRMAPPLVSVSRMSAATRLLFPAPATGQAPA